MCVTDIPTPYRVHLFGFMQKVLKERQISFEVLFMARSVSTRFGEVDLADVQFDYRVARGLHPRFGDTVFHINPAIWWTVLRHPPSWVLLGGAWVTPTTGVLALASPIARRRCTTILWAEVNPASSRFATGLVARLRQVVVRSAAAFAVPGSIAKLELAHVGGVADCRFLHLPNVVDEESLQVAVQRLRRRRTDLRSCYGVRDHELALLWPARLREVDKGILNFLKVIREATPGRVKILIAGEGPDHVRVEDWLASTGFDSVALLGHVPSKKMLELFAIADVCLLPSLSDPNPLSVIEALWAGLPLFISDRCGNWPEALEEGRNGWLVNPLHPSDMKEKFQDLLQRSPAQLTEFGRRSTAIAQERFATLPIVRGFVDAVEQLQ